MLRVDSINVSYGDVQVLEDVSLNVGAEEIVALVGANGAGKTTLLRAVSGLIHPASGEILLEGNTIHKLPPHKVVDMGIAHVPEGRHLFPEMTVQENLEMGARPARAREHRSESFDRVGKLFPVLLERRAQIAGTLSGGEQQMLAIGRALMSRPRLLLLDEPSLGIAPIVVEMLFDTIRKINQEGVTVLLVEQNALDSLELAHRGYVIENGRIVKQGAADALLEDDAVKEAYLGV
jgi:branched-chain amino acid transport system ATP-binding protein